MVQVLAPIQGFGEKLAETLGKAGLNITQGYYQGKENKGADQLFDILNDPKSTPLQKMTASMQLPEKYQKHGAQALSSYLQNQQKITQEENKQKAEQTLLQTILDDVGLGGTGNQQSGGGFLNQPGAHGPNDQTQNAQDFSNISDEKLAKLSLVDPQKANALRQVVQNQRQQKADQEKVNLENISNTKFSEGYKAIENDDAAAFSKIISDPQTPYDVKNKLSNLKNQHDVRKDVKAREIRTKQNFLKSAYTKAINAEKNRLANARPKDQKEIGDRIKELVKLQKQDMKKFSENPESYHQLSIWNSEASQYLPEEDFEEDMNGEEGFKKVPFDPKNLEHVNRAKIILKVEGGDRAKTNERLAREFTL